MPELPFTVDAALLRELGERLVGKPHIALAELVKNGYDADARKVTIKLALDQNRIEVLDNGHGMTIEEFQNFWMRIGTPHKGNKRVSRHFSRPMTGSKGVGRLSVQFLARKLKLVTVSEDGGKWIIASVNWEKAVKASELTNATVKYVEMKSAPPFPKGTKIILTGLKDVWNAKNIQDLAGQLWWLQPPFRSTSKSRFDIGRGEAPKNALETDASFAIEFQSTEPEFVRIFNQQMKTILGFWMARLVGRNDKGKVTLSLEFAGSEPKVYEYSISDFDYNQGKYDDKKNLNDGDFEVRIYKLQDRQPGGIKVDEARAYFRKFGGVHVYDGGFRLPYYGGFDSDWLSLEVVHSHRKFVSELLPQEFQEKFLETQRLRFLPTLERVFGVVNVNTSREPNLKIMITRDRLAESVAFRDLVTMIRYALDLYAYEESLRQYVAGQTSLPIVEAKFDEISQVLDYYKKDIPSQVYNELSERVEEVSSAFVAEQKRNYSQVSLLGPLATAGISALAVQHELRKQFNSIQGMIEKIDQITTSDPTIERSLESFKNDLSSWLQRARATNSLFDYMSDAENTKERSRLHASSVIDEVKRQTEFFAKGIEVDTNEVQNRVYLPEASFAEWGAIFQNVFINAYNAMLDTEEKVLKVCSRVHGKEVEIRIQDTGRGVKLNDAERLFEPFEREERISRERRVMGYGGTGLGLTIVRLLAQRIGCNVRFTQPDDGFSTAFSITWRESQ